METEEKTCRRCKESFTIETTDFDFYEKIQVPPPTLCPDCRQQRRLAWRNERVLYRRDCDLCKKSSIGIYSPDSPYTVYCPKCWWSDDWDALDYGRDFDFSRPFFEQMHELQLHVPRMAQIGKNSVNSDYTNHSSNNKNCYLCTGVVDSENCMYSDNIWEGSQDCVDVYHLEGHNELAYECVDCWNVYRCQFGLLLKDCSSCYYCVELHGCTDCFLSYNLRNKSYCFMNKQLTREQYLEEVIKYNLASNRVRKELLEKYNNMITQDVLFRATYIEQSVDCTGNMIFKSRNGFNNFDCTESEDTRYSYVGPGNKNSMDGYHYGWSELVYDSHALMRDYETFFCHLSYDCSHITYADSCQNSENLFGCVGIKKGSYMILNKKYTEEEYKILKEKIIAHMQETGEYGEFFPIRYSPFGYNETQGAVYMPMTREQVLEQGWRWQENMPGTFGKETIKPEDIPDTIDEISDTITTEVLKCEISGKNYNIVPAELQFYRQNNIPIPRLHPHERYMRRIKLRPDRKLYKRTSEDGAEVVTAYHPDRPERILSEDEYRKRIL